MHSMLLLQLLEHANDDALRALHRKLQVGAAAAPTDCLLLQRCLGLPIAVA